MLDGGVAEAMSTDTDAAAEPENPRLSCDRCGNPIVGPCSWTHEGVICNNCEIVNHKGFLDGMGQ